MFQGEGFSLEAHDQSFSIKVPMALKTKYGGSHYATFSAVRHHKWTTPRRRTRKGRVDEDDEFGSAEVRRVVASKSFETIFDSQKLCYTVTGDHPVRPAVPRKGKRMSFAREIILVDRNGEEHVCIGEAFYTHHQTHVLIRDCGRRTRTGILVPGNAAGMRRYIFLVSRSGLPDGVFRGSPWKARPLTN